MTFETSMIREKMVIMEDNPGSDEVETTVLRSNRVGLELFIPRLGTEFITVRGQNMHCTLRMATRILKAHYTNGALLLGRRQYDAWATLWDQCLTNYERDFNPDNWISVFGNGKTLYTTAPSIYMEVLEKCDHVNKGDYQAAVTFAEQALKDINRPVKIDHDATLAVIVTATSEEVKCGIIHRAGGRETIFNYTAEGGSREEDRLTRSMFMAASWLEGINLGFFIADIQDQVKKKRIANKSEDVDKMNAAIKRRNSIIREADRFESEFTVRYRPERPDLFKSL